MVLGDLLADPSDGTVLTQQRRHRQIVELAVLAESLGFDSVWLGEHHFCDYILSSPAVMLAAIAERTERIRLGTAVTLLSNLDPVRVAEDYATLDLLSGGRVELGVGRGIIDKVHEGFGQDPAEARARMTEHLELLVALWSSEEVSWSGTFRPPIDGLRVEPHPVQRPHPPIWVGGGTTLESAGLAARLGLGLMLPSVLAAPERFLPAVEHYRESFQPRPGALLEPQVGACSHVHVAATSEQARRRWEPYHVGYLDWLADLVAWGGLRREAPPRQTFDQMLAGPSICGSPDEVTDRLLSVRDRVGLDVHLAMFDHGAMPPPLVEDSMALFAASVIPAVA